MNNFNRDGGFKGNSGKFGSKPKFGGGDKSSMGNKKFDGSREHTGGSGQRFPATCSQCRKSCEVPFRPSGDKPVYCADCFSQRLTESNRGEDRGGRHDRTNSPKPPREERAPRHNPSRGQNETSFNEIKHQLAQLEQKLNRLLEIVNPPLPSVKVPQAEVTPVEGKVRKPKRAPKVKTQPTKAPRKLAAKKAASKKVTKLATKKTAAKKVVKK